MNRCDRTLPPGTTRFVERVTANLLREFAGGPVGHRREARDSVAAFDLPLVNTMDAS